MKSTLFTLAIALLASATYGQSDYVIMVSLDGFRSDYIEKYQPKHILHIAKNGVRVKRMIPSNPTKTFPNHYTLATGLYPDNHGLIGNAFYDPEMDMTYKLSDRATVENGAFYGGEPIWNTARKAGLRTASYFWVGTEAAIDSMQPHIWKKYNSSVTFEARIDSVISWLQLPADQRPRLTMLYFNEPDHTGHNFGPDSEEVAKKIEYVDQQIGQLHSRLMQLPIADSIHLILVADHGMRSISADKQIILANHVDQAWIEGFYGSNPVYTVKATAGYQDSLYEALSQIEHLHVYRRGQAPDSLHLANHVRTNDMILIGDRGYSVFATFALGRRFGGTHGYLNDDEQMSALFVAKGPRFEKGHTQEFIKNVDVYNLVTYLLNIPPAPNDGDFDRVIDLLKEKAR